MFVENHSIEFTRNLRAHVKELFKATSIHTKGGKKISLKVTIIVSGLLFSYSALIFFGPIAATFSILFLTLSIFFQIAAVLGIMHDASHYALFRKRWLNKLFCYAIFHSVGCSAYIWHFKHVKAHHHNTNISGQDHDIDGGPLFKFSTKQPNKPWHKFQYLYAIPLYCLIVIKWIVYDDLFDLIRNKYNLNSTQKRKCLTDILSSRVLYFILSILLPYIAFNSVLNVILCWTIYNAVFGLILTLVFQSAHINTETTFFNSFKPGPDDFVLLQLMTTADYSTKNKWLTWYIGGLNFQVIHHLFPTICHTHYPAIQKILKDTLKSYPTLTYHEFPSFHAAIKDHFKALKIFPA